MYLYPILLGLHNGRTALLCFRKAAAALNGREWDLQLLVTDGLVISAIHFFVLRAEVHRRLRCLVVLNQESMRCSTQ